MATYISRTPSSAGNRKKFTISMWVKRGGLGIDHWLVQGGTSGTEFDIRFNTSDQIRFSEYASSTGYGLITNRKFRDTAAWYHLVFTYDSAQSTDTDRNKIYVNGEQILASDCTAYDSGKHPPQNHDNAAWNNTTEFRINDVTWTTSSAKDASYTHIHHTDGYAYAASDFGETDSTSGIWKPKTAPSVTYGTNGFFLKFENAGNLDVDSSGNNLTFSTSGNLTQNVDTPSNNYATLTPLYTIEYNSAQFFTNVNTTTNSNTTQWNTVPCTMEVSSGKWYFEGYGHTNGSHYVHYGITSSEKMIANATQAQSEINTNSNGYAYGYYGYNGSIYYSTTSSSSSASYGDSYGNTDYIGIFADLDNNKLYFAKNGTLQNSGTGYDISADGKPYILATAVYNGLTNVNFGSGVFGTTALTGTTYADANGHGTFKYSPNQGGAANFDSTAKNFYAMNSKNLKEFG